MQGINGIGNTLVVSPPAEVGLEALRHAHLRSRQRGLFRSSITVQEDTACHTGGVGVDHLAFRCLRSHRRTEQRVADIHGNGVLVAIHTHQRGVGIGGRLQRSIAEGAVFNVERQRTGSGTKVAQHDDIGHGAVLQRNLLPVGGFVRRSEHALVADAVQRTAVNNNLVDIVRGLLRTHEGTVARNGATLERQLLQRRTGVVDVEHLTASPSLVGIGLHVVVAIQRLVADEIHILKLQPVNINALGQRNTTAAHKTGIAAKGGGGNEAHALVDGYAVVHLVVEVAAKDDGHSVLGHHLIPECLTLQGVLGFLLVVVADIYPHAGTVLLIEVDGFTGGARQTAGVGGVVELTLVIRGVGNEIVLGLRIQTHDVGIALLKGAAVDDLHNPLATVHRNGNNGFDNGNGSGLLFRRSIVVIFFRRLAVRTQAVLASAGISLAATFA